MPNPGNGMPRPLTLLVEPCLLIVSVPRPASKAAPVAARFDKEATLPLGLLQLKRRRPKAKIETLGPVTDVSKLAVFVKATRELGDFAGQIANSKRKEEEARTAISRGLKSLRPAIADHVVPESMLVPPLATVEAHREASRNLEQGQQTCRERIRNAQQELIRHKKAYERIIADEHVVAADELERLRHRRNTGWSIIRRRPS